MKLTPLDIHHKEFRHSLRGYSEEEVDAFLDEVADEFERLFKENIDLNERLEASAERLRGYQSMEATLNNTLVQAQRSAEEIVAKAGVEAETMLRDAEIKAKEIIHSALQKKQAVANELVRIKQAEEDFRSRYRGALETQMRALNEIDLPDDVSVLLGETEEGVVSDVSVAPRVVAPAAAPVQAPAAPAPAPVAEPAPEPAPMIVPTPAPAAEPFADATEVASPFIQSIPAEPPASGFVQSVTLGEVEPPELPAGPVDLIEPGEFELPGFEALGEREDDSDIEEID
jgi:cell division initiation protein